MESEHKSCRGRPREFCCEQALDKAMQVFWEKGYEGATLPALTEAMGINRPSLYAAFGNKEELFRKVLDRYQALREPLFRDALDLPTAHAAMVRLLHNAVDWLSDKSRPAGCLFIQSAMACGDEADAVREETRRRRQSVELAIRHRLEAGQRAGELPQEVDVHGLGFHFTTVVMGMGVMAASGASKEELAAAAEHAMSAWPSGALSR